MFPYFAERRTMKASDLLEKTDRLKPNSASMVDKLDWLNEVDAFLVQEVFDRALDNAVTANTYTFDNMGMTDLLVSIPYTDMYRYYINAKIDESNNEIASYNNNMTLYNAVFDQFAAYYRRNHMPKG